MSHFYNTAGELVPPGTPGGLWSVTTILDVRNKPELNNWKASIGLDEAWKVQQEARLKGTTVHNRIEAFLASGEMLLGLDEEINQYLQGFQNWYDKAEASNLQPEIFLIHSQDGYAGRADLVCLLEEELWIVDYKTSKQMDKGMGLQLTAYAEAYKAMFGVRPRQAILQLTPKLKRGYRFKEFNEPYAIFKAHLDIFNWQPPVQSAWDGGLICNQKTVLA